METDLKLQELELKNKELNDKINLQEENYRKQVQELKENNDKLKKVNQDYFNRITTSYEEVKVKSEEPKLSFDEFTNKLGGNILWIILIF